MTNLNDMSLDEMESALINQDPNDLDTEKSDDDGGDTPPAKDGEDGGSKDDDGSDKSDNKSDDDGGDTPPAKDGEDGDQKKETPKNIKKLLEQRNEARKERDELKSKVSEQDEYIKKLENGELDDDFKDADGEVDEVKKDRALIKAENKKAIMEYELEKTDGSIIAKREQDLDQFIEKNPDYVEFKEDIKKYANDHQNLDIDDIATLIIAKSDPTRLLDEQTKNKRKGGYGLDGKDRTIDNKSKNLKDMSDADLEKALDKEFKNGTI